MRNIALDPKCTRANMSPSKSSGAYETLINLRDKMTRLNGVITPEAVDRHEDELSGIFTIVKTHHYEQGQKYGHLVSAIPEAKYRLVIADPTWTHTVLGNPAPYSVAALLPGTSAAQREQLVATHKVTIESHASYLKVEEAGKEFILYAVGDDALAPLKKQYIGFGDETVLTMIVHLRTKTAIKMTTAQKHEYRTNGYNAMWDPTTSITAYFTTLDRFQVSLEDRGIATSVEEKCMAAGSQMWASEMFTEEQMVGWENKPTIDQTWPNLQVYFTEKWLERKQYSTPMAKQSRFKEAVLAAQEKEAAEAEGETQAMLFAMLQEQHDKQIASMEATNKANMDAMMERMNALVASGYNKENVIPPGATPAGGGTKRPRAKKHHCPNCKKMVIHKATDCYELEANKDKRFDGWKSAIKPA
mgnify:CR=1 FL=1